MPNEISYEIVDQQRVYLRYRTLGFATKVALLYISAYLSRVRGPIEETFVSNYSLNYNMSNRPAKRARSDSPSDAVDPLKIPELVGSLDPKTISQLLITAAKIYPNVASLVRQEVDRTAAADCAKALYFDGLSQSAWRALNVTYDRLRESGQAGDEIEYCIEEIQRSCPKTATFKTKENALETLRKIGKSICLSVGVVGQEIRRSGGLQTALISTMLGIAGSLADEEIERLWPWCNEKLVELQGIANDCCVFEDLDKVIHFWGEDREAWVLGQQ